MSRQTNDGRCSCWKRVNKSLAEHGDQLSEVFTFTGHQYLMIATKKKEKSRKQPKRVFASFCPFCGKELKTKVVKNG